MRRILTISSCFAALLSLGSAPSWAQQPFAVKPAAAEHCTDSGRLPPPCRCPRCSPPTDCTEPPTRTPRELPPTTNNRDLQLGPENRELLGPQGTYVAPPRSGVTVGESRGWGVNGMAITLPSIRLAMPSIELPSLYRASRGAHMRVDSATAPFVEHHGQFAGQVAGVPAMAMGVGLMPQAGLPQVVAPQAAPRSLPATDRSLSPSDRSGPPEEPADAPRSRNLAPRDCTKGQFSQTLTPTDAQLSEELTARIQRLDLAERQLQEKLTRLQQHLDAIETERQPRTNSAAAPHAATPDAGPQPVYQEGRQATPRPQPVTSQRATKNLVQPSAYLPALTTMERLPPVQ
ncbi:MAG: hypothetical protein ACKOUR_15865 [Planctomycetota bacterium]